jgi:hypothetical protein
MKKLLALLAVVLAVVSCQKEINGLAVDSNNEAAVSLSVALPEGATRAAGADSALGAIDNGVMNNYDVRFILEVYDMSGAAPELAKERMVKCGNETTATFNFRLVPGRDYNFVVWADFVLNDSESDLHYDTNVNGLGLRAVAIKDWTAIDESRDAYTESVRVDNYNGTSKIGENGVITLTRPFAKLRVVTNDIKEMISIRPSVVKVNYFSTKFYTAFDALYENPIDQTYNGHTLTVNLAEDFYANERPEQTGVQTLFADYFFAKEGDRVMFTMDVETNHGPAIPQVTFNTNIPVKRNNLTTVYGPILTDANNVTVTINPAFEKNENTIPDTTKEALEFAAVCGGEVTLTDNVTLDETLVVNPGSHLIINLNDKYYIRNKVQNKLTDVIIVREGATLTINGEGTIEAVSGNDGYAIISEGTVIINGGTFKSGVDAAGAPNAVIYARGKGKVFVNGGTFLNDNNSKFVLNKKDADRATTTIEVRGGKFQNFNPANNAAEGEGTNFLAEGYGSYRIGDYFEVKKPSEAVYYTLDFETVKSVFRYGGKLQIADSFTGGDVLVTEALIADGVNVEITGTGEIYLKSGVDTIYEQGVVSAVICAKNGGTVTFNDYSGYVDGGANDYAVEVRDGGKVVINSGHFKGAVSAVYAVNGAVEINGGEFWANDSAYGANYLLNCSDANYNANLASIVVKGGEYHGFNPAANAAEGKGTNFVAQGYKSVEKTNGVWTVSQIK